MGSHALSVCNDCLCLMALFRAVMSSLHDWAEWSVWTGTGSGYYRTITWEGGYLPRLCPPCDVDRLCDYMAWQINGPVMIVMLDWDEHNSPQRCAGKRGTSLGVLSAGRIPRIVIGRLDCGGSPVDSSDWTRVRGVVDFSPGEVRIGHIRGALWDRSSTDAAPVTGSLVFSEGVVPLRFIPDVIGLAGRRSDAAESRILQGRDVRSVRVLVPDPRGLDQNFHDVTLSTWVMCRSRPFPYRNYRRFVSCGHLRSSVTWCGFSRN